MTLEIEVLSHFIAGWKGQGAIQMLSLTVWPRPIPPSLSYGKGDPESGGVEMDIDVLDHYPPICTPGQKPEDCL